MEAAATFGLERGRAENAAGPMVEEIPCRVITTPPNCETVTWEN